MRNIKNKISNFIKLNIVYRINSSGHNVFRSIVPPLLVNKKNNIIERNVIFQDWDTLTKFGNHNFIGRNTYIESCKSIGSYSSISFDVKIGLKNHNLETVSTSPYFYRKNKGWVKNDNQPKSTPVIIGHDVLISANAIILENVTIGTGAVIAAGAVVNKNVPPYAIVGGIPSKVIKYRFSSDTIEELLKSKWWELPSTHLKRLHPLFQNPEKFLSEIKKVC